MIVGDIVAGVQFVPEGAEMTEIVATQFIYRLPSGKISDSGIVGRSVVKTGGSRQIKLIVKDFQVIHIVLGIAVARVPSVAYQHGLGVNQNDAERTSDIEHPIVIVGVENFFTACHRFVFDVGQIVDFPVVVDEVEVATLVAND